MGVLIPANAKPMDPAKGPETKPAKNLPDPSFMAAQRAQRDNARNQYAGLPDGGETNLADLVKFNLDRGLLSLDVTGSAVRGNQRYTVKGVNAVWTLNRSSSNIVTFVAGNRVLRNTSSTTLTRLDLGVKDDAENWNTYASSNGTYVSVTGQSVNGRVMFSQNLGARNMGNVNAMPIITLAVTEWQGGPQAGGGARLANVFRGTAKSLDDLRAKFPDEFRSYFIPLLQKLSDMAWLTPGATDVYSVFTDIAADPTATGKVSALLPDLDSDSFTIREAASRQLLELGPTGVLAALRMDRSQLSDEQKGQLGRLIAAHRRRDLNDPSDVIKDTAFLTDCLEHPQVAVRKSAKSALEKVLGQSIAFDVDAPSARMGPAADEVRKLVLKNVSTTQPADAIPPIAPPAPVPNIMLR